MSLQVSNVPGIRCFRELECFLGTWKLLNLTQHPSPTHPAARTHRCTSPFVASSIIMTTSAVLATAITCRPLPFPEERGHGCVSTREASCESCDRWGLLFGSKGKDPAILCWPQSAVKGSLCEHIWPIQCYLLPSTSPQNILCCCSSVMAYTSSTHKAGCMLKCHCCQLGRPQT